MGKIKENRLSKFLAILLAFMMVFTTVPFGMGLSAENVWAADEAVTEISTPEGFANMDPDGNYKLVDNIEVTQPYSKSFRGTFDGDGHTITANLNVTSGNVGLFAKTGSNAKILNLVVNAQVTSSVASSYYGTGGLVGQIDGPATIENCGVKGEVNNTSTSTSSPVYIGGIVGYLSDSLTIRNSFSSAGIKASSGSSSSSSGGLVGKGGSYSITAENSYATGEVTGKYYVGGLVGYGTASSYKPHTYTNVYTAVQVTGDKAYALAYNSNANYCTMNNCYYDNSNAKAFNGKQEGITGKSSAELKGLATALGEAFQEDKTNLNNGYPILDWQYIDPEATCTVKFNVNPKESVLTWNGEEQAVSKDGSYTFENVKVGDYTYKVSNEAGDYAEKSGKTSAKGKDIEQNVSLELNKHKLAFETEPNNLDLVVKSGEEVLEPESGRTYSVVNGTYSYEASAFGYKSKAGNVEVNRGDKTETVKLDAQPMVTVTFAYDGNKTDVNKGKIEVTTGEKTMEAKADSKGMVYELPAGYNYSYKFTSANYARQIGEIDLTAVTEAENQSVKLLMKEKTAWEGAEDIIEPTKDNDGVYLISSGSELAWLAQQVNSGNNASCSAVLTKDIDLGGVDNWMPIGNYRHSFQGNFDGQGHTVKNLKIVASGSDNYALFGYVKDGNISNVIVDGKIDLTGSGSGSYGVAGLVGKFDGTKGNIENCINKVTVNGSQNVGGIVGYVPGGYNSTATKSILNCINEADIKSNSNNAAGIAGYVSGQVTIDSCYNRGNCTTGSWRAGGIVAYLSNSYAKINNCYSTGAVSGGDAKPVVGKKYSGAVADCYYLDILGKDENATAKTADELKALAPTLGGNFIAAPNGMNDGYPILKFQIPTYQIKFTVNDENAVVSIEGQDGKHEGNTWTFTLPDGEYAYTVSSYGKVSQYGKITVKGAGQEKDITLEKAKTKDVSFDITPKDANVTVSIMLDSKVVESGAARTYTLPYGEYTYLIKAKGYAKVSDTLKVDETSDASVKIMLTESSAWDGETLSKPSGDGTEASPYIIDDGEMLAWLAQEVNKASSVKSVYVELADDINLDNNTWTPIGKDFHEFQGSFDGKGYTVSGINVKDTTNAGLFGVIKGAEIKNLIVSGTISGTENAGGIAGKAKDTDCKFINCGNEATVNGKNSAGILGYKNTYELKCELSGCYNSGNITASERAGGIVGYNNGSNSNLKVINSYNLGNIKSSDYAGGILGGAGVSVTNSYNTGNISGNGETKTGAFATSGDSFVNCFYLEGYAKDRSEKATAVSSAELQKLVISDEFEHVSGINRNYPVLKWQGLKAKAGKVVFAKNTEFEMEKVAMDGATGEDDDDFTLLPTPILKWKALEGATKYVVTIWQKCATDVTVDEDSVEDYIGWPDEEVMQYLTDEQFAEYKKLAEQVGEGEGATYPRAEYLQKFFKENYGGYELETKQVATIYDVEGTKYDSTKLFNDLGEGVYYAAVVAMNADGSCIMPTADDVEDKVIGYQSPYNRLKKVTGLKWDENTKTKAIWDAKDNFTENDQYTINLYKVTGKGEKAEDFHFFKSFQVSGKVHASDFRNAFAAETDYAFTVTANVGIAYQSKYGMIDSPESDMSPVYKAQKSETPGENHEGWTAISSAEEWIKLANVEDAFSVPGDTTSPNLQEIEWSKNYYLTDDIDFSTLSAADQAKTKSIGNINYRFMGKLDGNGHKIKGLTLSNNDAGLFWYVGSTGYIYNLIIENANVLFSDNAAVVAQNNYGKIEKCGVINCNITADTGAVLGGMVSRNYGIIRESYVEGGSLTSNSDRATGHAGFVGANETGGLIERCWTSMNIKTDSDYAAGFVGLGYGGTVRDCFALGNVNARSYSGGFVGRSVYQGNVYENCYAAGKVTVTGKEGHGFIGGNKPDSSFQTDQSKTITNCYYNAESPKDENGAIAKTLAEMKTEAFLSDLNKDASWSQDAEHNEGLPYLTDVKAPEKTKTSEITVDIALATYDKNDYKFVKKDDTISVTMESNGNTRLVDLMDAAVAQGKLTYEYETSAAFGRFIKTINGYSINAPDGWMFTINDDLSNVSASLATVKNGDRVLWYEGTTENHFQGPLWAELENPNFTWTDIKSVEELEALAASDDDDVLAKNYRLTKDLDLKGKDFSGIGSSAHPFTGIFDGQNNKISDFVINGSGEGTGFFNVILGATVKNLKLEKAEITGTDNVGALVGWAKVQLDKNNMKDNVANLVGNCSASGTVKGEKQVGGLVGLNDGKYDKDTLFSISSSVNKGSFDGTVVGDYKVGGLVGDNEGTVTKGDVSGEVKAAEGATRTAAMVGGFIGDNAGSVYDGATSATVSGNNSVGGFAGISDGIVKNCYSTGNVKGSSNVGGFAGSISKAENVIGAGTVTVTGDSLTGYAGGFAGNMGGTLVGIDSRITIKNAFGNCVASDGKILGTIGNINKFTGDEEKKILGEMGLTTIEDVSDKLFEMFGVRLEGVAEIDLEEVLGNIDAAVSSSITSNSNAAWQMADLIAYADAYGNGKVELSDAKKQELLNYFITTGAEATGAGDVAKSIIAMKAMGYDARKVETVNSTAGSYFNMVDKLKDMVKNKTGGSDSIYNLPYILIALQQDDKYATEDEIKSVVDMILTQQLTDGGWGYTYEEKDVLDMDASAPVILALSKYYKSNDAVKTALDKVLNADVIGKFQGKTGAIYSSWTNAPSAESTGLVLAGLAACGKDYKEYKVGPKNLVDGLARMLNKEKNGFLYSGETNVLATEQGFRGLLAAKQGEKIGKAYNIYDFSNKGSAVAKATGNGATSKPSEPTGKDDITVYLTVKTDTDEWLGRTAVTVKDGATVYHALTSGLAAAGMSQKGAEDGYVKSITKGNVTLGEFDKGQNSGWLYKVNNFLPAIPLTSYKLSGGDEILWYYTADYKQDPAAGGMGTPEKEVTTSGSGASTITKSPTDVTVSNKTNTDGTVESTATVTVKKENQEEIIKQAKENNSKDIVLDVAASDSKGADNIQLELPKDMVNSIVKDTQATVTVKSEQGELTIDKETLAQISKDAKGGAITVIISKVKTATEEQKKLTGESTTVYKLTVMSGNEVISQFNGKITVKLPIPAVLLDKTVAAVHFDGADKFTVMDGKRVSMAGAEYYAFDTTHFSEFGLVDAKEAGIATDDSKDDTDKLDNAAKVKKAKKITSKMKLTTVTTKTKKKNVKVNVKMTKTTKTDIHALKKLGYNVKYSFYRSTKKGGTYTLAATKKANTYTYLKGKKAKRYYYKTQIRVYDKKGKLITKTTLKNSKYASKIWAK